MRRALLTFALLLCTATTGCAPHAIEPAVGSSLDYSYCGQTPTTLVYVWRRPSARCPDLDRLDLRYRRVEERTGQRLAGAKLFVTDAYIECDDGTRTGCTVGTDMTVYDFGRSPGARSVFLGVAEHEGMHAGFFLRGGDGDFGHIDLHERSERIRNTILLGD